METVLIRLGQFQRFLSCDLDTGLHTCYLGIGLYGELSENSGRGIPAI